MSECFPIDDLQCDVGYFKDSVTGLCTMCAIGTYSNTTDADSCTSCPDGQTTNQKGSVSIAQCYDSETLRICIIVLINSSFVSVKFTHSTD